MGQNVTVLSNESPVIEQIKDINNDDISVINRIESNNDDGDCSMCITTPLATTTTTNTTKTLICSDDATTTTTTSETNRINDNAIMLLKMQTKEKEKKKIEKQLSKYATKLFGFHRNLGILSSSSSSNKLIRVSSSNSTKMPYDHARLTMECNKNAMYLKLLNKNWKLSLYFALNNSSLVCNLEIPFEILHVIILACEGSLRRCDICKRDVLDLRFTKGYGCKPSKNEMKKYKLVVCNHCHSQVAASYQRVDKNLEAMGMRLR